MTPHLELVTASPTPGYLGNDHRRKYARAVQLHLAGDLHRAEELYRAVIEYDPEYEDCLHHLGIVLYQQARYTESTQYLERAVSLNPKNAVYHSNYANALQESGALDDAILNYESAIAINSDFADAHFNLGNAYSKKNVLDLAIKSYTNALELKSDYAAALSHRGIAFFELKRFDEALADFNHALEIDPSFLNAYVNRGNTLRALGRSVEALDSYDQALQLGTVSAEAHLNRAQALQDLNRSEEALASYDQALAIRPDYPKAISAKGLIYLQLGRFEEGWPLYEWRWHPSLTKSAQRKLNGTLWRGSENLEGKTILLYAEQGLGDTIQFARYVELVKKRGGNVILQVQKGLLPLMRSLCGYDELVDNDEHLPKVDYICPLMSLPLAFKTTVESVPTPTPYLTADPARIDRWQRYLGHDGLKIAVAWQANKTTDIALRRSFPLRHLKRISAMPGVRLISLQKHDGVEHLGASLQCDRLEVLPSDFDEDGAFLDSAAVMECVDLVITCDTALTHLAGALGVRAWLPLRYSPEWRWMLNTDRTPWYPNHLLFRQEAPDDWHSAFETMECQLALMLGCR